MLNGVQIIISDAAVKVTDERLFPFSRHRSQRIRKKLLQRFGGEFRVEPACYQMGDRFVVHPVMAEKLRQHEAIKLRDSMDRNVYAALARNPLL